MDFYNSSTSWCESKSCQDSVSSWLIDLMHQWLIERFILCGRWVCNYIRREFQLTSRKSSLNRTSKFSKSKELRQLRNLPFYFNVHWLNISSEILKTNSRFHCCKPTSKCIYWFNMPIKQYLKHECRIQHLVFFKRRCYNKYK